MRVATEILLLKEIGVDIPNIYRWETRYGFTVYITEKPVLDTIKHNLENRDILSLHDFLYSLLINYIGTLNFIKVLDTYMEILLREKYDKGLNDKQFEALKTLGVQGG